MSRELKFRAWDGKIMYSSFSLLNGLNAKFVPFLGPYEEGDVFMQFTGLLDKNGKEIYEGDILKAHKEEADPTESVTFIATVKFDHCAFLFCGEDVDDIHPLGDMKSEYLSVIGNIHENPELLK